MLQFFIRIAVLRQVDCLETERYAHCGIVGAVVDVESFGRVYSRIVDDVFITFAVRFAQMDFVGIVFLNKQILRPLREFFHVVDVEFVDVAEDIEIVSLAAEGVEERGMMLRVIKYHRIPTPIEGRLVEFDGADVVESIPKLFR